MTHGFLLSRLLLQFQSEADDLLAELSAVARTPDGSLWLGSDEYLTVERLTPMGHGVYGHHTAFHLKDYLPLPDLESEIDIEGLDYSDGYLWLVGSHSLKRNKTKGKKAESDIRRLSEIKQDPNRFLLARLPVLNGEIVPTYSRPTYSHPNDTDPLSAARLLPTDGYNQLIKVLAEDEHLGLFVSMGLPSKENGLDIEGLAVHGSRIFLGLRGPVLRGWAIILELELEKSAPDTLILKSLGERPYRKHFVELNGQGIRDLCLLNDDLIILAGPTMALEGSMQMFCLRHVLDFNSDTLWDQESDRLQLLFNLPFTIGADHAEGLELIPCFDTAAALMVVYDSPHPNRRPAPNAVFADIFQLPALDSDS